MYGFDWWGGVCIWMEADLRISDKPAVRLEDYGMAGCAGRKHLNVDKDYGAKGIIEINAVCPGQSQ